MRDKIARDKHDVRELSMGTTEEQSITIRKTRKDRLRAVKEAVVQEGLRRRDDPGFSLLEFTKEMIRAYGNEPFALYAGLEVIGRNWFNGYAPGQFALISHAFGLTPETSHDEVIRQMMPFLLVVGRSVTRDYLAQMGFTNREINYYQNVAERNNWDASHRGELDFRD